ncbi:hypothetical protein BO70DRAFT_357436 [Aspergillus heteromorphus CBS 117.55]|uniref:Uncharacterized protein n=1 Tax=Aspergillus heteromorphus CBS 117.55 TaxID=1448321 RepID=A0A317X3Y3_9EURO|nr:uncharacterized protein BO70DRAFT_357436 [Aspergillus heteromorphus CBS 117.55]PWY92322.1 hypothetical protein BO70DRAFT_357436 [Aspergillus heteromorphus CBS 117.55]
MVAYPGGLTGGRPQSVRSRNMAIFSIFGVLAGSWLLFRAQSPSKEDKLYTQKEAQTMVGGQTGENKIARAPNPERKA